MHDLDHTLTEAELEAEDYGMEELELEDEPFMEFEEGESAEPEEAEELELASELLEVASEAELELFLDKLRRRVRKGLKRVGRAARGRVGGLVKRGLKRLAKRLLPVAGGAVGGVFGGPAGALVGKRLARGAGKLLGLELEGLSPEDQEFEVARRFVRLAQEAFDEAEELSDTQEEQEAARHALVRAARRHAPGLLRKRPARPSPRVSVPSSVSADSGRWVRRGNTIVLLGV